MLYTKNSRNLAEMKELENLKAENESLKQQVSEQADALIELANMITQNGGTSNG